MSNTALAPGQSAAVIASAGTGKTWTLTARIVRLLLAGAEPGGILALTFTRKAAAEMRERVASVLQKLAYASDADAARELASMNAETDAATLAKARGLFEAFCFAPIPLKAQTLHSFCAELLSRFALEAQVPAGFGLAEDERELREAAVERLLVKLHRAPQSAESQALDTLLALGMTEWDIRKLLDGFFEQRSAYWASTVHHEQPVAALSARLADALEIVTGAAPTAATDDLAASGKLKVLYRLLSTCGDLQYIKAAALLPALDAGGNRRLDVLIKALLKSDGLPYSTSGTKKYTAEQQATLIQLLDVVALATITARQARLKANTLARTAAALTLGAGLLAAFAEAQSRARVLGFAELEWHTCRLLTAAEGAAWVRFKLDAQLEHLLLDEFQDTNPTQWRLLLPLLEEFAQAPEAGRTAFLVGDAKQSIYGFRGANAALLTEASNWLESRLHAKLSKLNESRRSAPAIIRFVNALFGNEQGSSIGFEVHSAHADLAEVYGAVEVAPLLTADAASKPDRSAPAVPDALRSPLTEPLQDSEESLAEREGRWVATRIAQLVEDLTPVTLGPESRALHYGDVMVLARSRTHLWAVEAALAAAHIPFTSATRGTLLATPLAQDLLALLRLLDAPHRDLDLAHALRAPIFAASDDDLLRLARAAREARSPWFAALNALEQPGAVLARARALLGHWRVLAAQLPPHDLLDRIVAEADLARRYQAATPLEAPRIAGNLNALLQLALAADQGRYPSLSGFIHHCELLSRENGPDETPPASAEPRVRVLTVHGAKGLEAPAVFLVNTAPKPPATRGGWKVEWPGEAASPTLIVHIGSKEQQDSLSQQLLEAQKNREAQEDHHLLYVAATRARQYLFVSGFEVGNGSQQASWHSRCRDALARLMPEAPSDPAALWAFDAGTPPPFSRQAAAVPPAIHVDAALQRPLPQAAQKPLVNRSPVDAAAVLRGQVIHALLERLAPALPARTGNAEWRASIGRALQASISEALFDDCLREAKTVIGAPALQAFFAPGLKAWNELPLHLAESQGELSVQVLDRLVDDGRTLWLLDYKTRQQGSTAMMLAAAAPQLRRYLAAVARLFPGRSLRAGIIATATAEWAELELLPPAP